ncbi:MAG: CAP domain-containing protein [Planctomycetota bacterium]|jgi:hypothetical protein
MKHAVNILMIVAAFALVVVAPGCGKSSSSSRDSAPTYDDGGGGTTGTTPTGGNTTGGTNGTATVSGGSQFASFDEGVAYLVKGRSSFYSHDPYKGWPAHMGTGTYHTNHTFPASFGWDDGLASAAQDEADRLAGGGSPNGTSVQGIGSDASYNPFWVDGLNSANWMISTKETDHHAVYGWGLCWGNYVAKQMWHYHDFGGDGPAITKWGVGAHDCGNGSTWWVLKMAP